MSERGGTEILIYAADTDGLFSRITAVLSQQGLNVVDAGIITTRDNHILDTFHVLEESGAMVEGDRRIDEIQSALLREINATGRDEWHISRRQPRQYKHFPIKTHITFILDEHEQRTIMELITADQPGLLSRVGRAFSDCEVKLQNAKIVTFGARAEDIYYITDKNDLPLSKPAQFECLEKRILEYLDTEAKQTDTLF